MPCVEAAGAPAVGELAAAAVAVSYEPAVVVGVVGILVAVHLAACVLSSGRGGVQTVVAVPPHPAAEAAAGPAGVAVDIVSSAEADRTDVVVAVETAAAAEIAAVGIAAVVETGPVGTSAAVDTAAAGCVVVGCCIVAVGTWVVVDIVAVGSPLVAGTVVVVVAGTALGDASLLGERRHRRLCR